MKIIYDNIIFSWQSRGGISVVCGKLIKWMMRHSKMDLSFIEYPRADRNIVRSNIDIPDSNITRDSGSFLKLRRYLDVHIEENEPFIFHSSYYRVCSNKNAINITTVHDFAYELYVKNPLVRFIHCWTKHRAIRKSDCIICISENTRRDLFRLLPDVPRDKVHVIPNGVEDCFHPLPEVKKGKFALYVGKRDRYKNFASIITPLAKNNIPLKIAGLPLTQAEKKAMDEAGLEYQRVEAMDEESLNRLYNEAFFFIYPSLYEGFGLPVLEAQKAGCPIVAINASSIPDIIGDKRLLLDNITVENIKTIKENLSNPNYYSDMVAAGYKNAEKYSWDMMAEKYNEIYESFLK